MRLAWSDLGVILSRSGRSEEAISAFERAIAADAELALPRNGLGVLYTEKRDFERAVSLFEEAIRLAPDFASAHLNLAQALRELGREAEALEHEREYERLEKREP